MRAPLLTVALSLLLAASAGAVKLQTHATVQLVDPATVQLDHWTADAVPAWKVTGTPGARVQVSLESTTADGRRLCIDDPRSLALEHGDRILTLPTAPAGDPHDPIDLVTLVVCRE